MQRIKVLGGRLTAEQWTALAALAREHTPGVPLHLTTRQDVEFDNLTPQAVPALQAGLAAAGLTGLGAGGDTLRNITVCPCSGVIAGRPELLGAAQAIRQALEGMAGIYALPRKFKIALSCGEDCGQPWINDLGLVATSRGGPWGFRVIAGGSLGPRPATGILLMDWLEAQDAPPLAVAAVRLFEAEGDRENRGKARLRHVRQRVGDAAFVAMLSAGLAAAKAERPWPQLTLAPMADGWRQQARLTFADGSVTPEAAEAIARVAALPGAAVRIDTRHRVLVFGADVAGAVAAEAALAEAARPQAAIVACPGTHWCARALVDTRAAAAAIRRELAGAIPLDAMICISGCPNGCAQNAVADVGLSGRVATAADGGRLEAFDISWGGGKGRSATLAAPAAAKVGVDRLGAEVRRSLGE